MDSFNFDNMTPRECKLIFDRLEHYISNLYHVKAIHENIYGDSKVFVDLTEGALQDRDTAISRMDAGRVEPRSRPKAQKSTKAELSERPTCYLFLDECGGHA